MRDTIDMAREAGYMKTVFGGAEISMASIDCLKAFEALVRADERNRTWTQEHWTEYERSIAAQEREACAKVCESEAEMFKSCAYGANDGRYDWKEDGARECAAAIRNRGNT